MNISQIELKNIGSYEGVCQFNFENSDPSARIVIIGGKNGAGKTTLFTAMQLCLYGFHTYGYKSATKLYYREVKHSINNHAILNNQENAYIRVCFRNTELREINTYLVERRWTWASEGINESVKVIKNGMELDSGQVEDFETYLLHIIPPDLLKLYFFDGEKIADYFLSEQKINIRNALMILSGNDTFDIIHDNVRRIMNSSLLHSDDCSSRYLFFKDEVSKLETKAAELQQGLEQANDLLSQCNEQLQQLTLQYARSGGLTSGQWDRVQSEIKAEEEKRDQLKTQRKVLATEVLPFLIVEDLVRQIIPQIRREETTQALAAFSDKLSSSALQNAWHEILEDAGIGTWDSRQQTIRSLSLALLGGEQSHSLPLFQLSDDEKIQIHSVLNRVLSFNRAEFKKLQAQLDDSTKKSRALRDKLQHTDLGRMEDFMSRKNSLEAEIKIQQANVSVLSDQLALTSQQLSEKRKQLLTVRKELENQLKRASVGSVSGKLLLLIENLQSILYSSMVKQVEDDLNRKFRELIRKPDFFEHITIDLDFNVHIIRKELIPLADIKQIYASGGSAGLYEKLGLEAVKELIHAKKAQRITEGLLERMEDRPYRLPMEFDKDRMSSGEKQIFVMALYYAIMQQSANQIPFVIDTPFARIDTEHRANITDHFFLELPGQLIVLSTNEELNDVHLRMMGDKISQIYRLDYGTDQRTRIVSDTYFEE